MMLKSFPRGGKKPEIKSSNNIFTKRTKIKTKKEKPKVKPSDKAFTEDEPILLNTAENLRFSTLREGMTILGRIFKITDYYAIVSLPGQVSGKLQATDISESYTNLLKSIANNQEISSEFKPISELYKEGDYIVCYIKELEFNSKKVSLSLEPQLINQHLNPSILTKSFKIVVNVSSVEDHGYVLETGLTNFRAFLSIKDVEDEEVKLYPGKQIMCAIKDVKIAENTFTAKVSIKSKHLDAVESNITSLNNLIPGTQVSLSVKKVLKNGLQVYFGEKNVGYINQLYLQNSLSSFEKGQELAGTLLYIVPVVNFAYFSLLSQDEEKKSLAIGNIIEKSKVLSHDTRGIIVQLKKGVKGLIPLKRTEVDFKNISTVFIKDSTHKSKIIAYDLMAKLYICSMEKKLLEQQFTSAVNLQTGDVVDVTITSIKGNGYVNVSMGNVSGMVPADETSDPESANKLTVGQIVKARVLKVKGKPIFTLKKSLIESKLPILCKIGEAKLNAVHDGTIAKLTDKGVLVRFFCNLKGWIPKRFLNPHTAAQKWNLVIGQTVTVAIKSVDINESKIILTFSKNKKVSNVNYNIGDIVEGVVTDNSTTGVSLRLKTENEEGALAFLPAGHMSPCIEVGKLLASKTVAGESLSAIVFSTKPNLILTTTFAPEMTHNINNLIPGDSLLCSVKKINKESAKVLLPIKKCLKYGTVPSNSAGNFESMYESQILFGKILKIDKETHEVILTTQLSKIWKDVKEHEVKMMTAVDMLSSYLNKLSELSKNIYYTSKAISKIVIGQRIKVIVEGVMENGLVLQLDKNIKGIVHKNNFVGKYKKGDQVEGSVLWVNYPHEYVEITLRSNVMNSLDVKQNKLAKIPIGVQLRGEIVLVTEWFVLVLLKGQGRGILAALPTRRHLNDIVPDLSPYQIGDKIRCYGVLNREDTDMLLPICLLKSAFETRNFDGESLVNNSSSKKRNIETTENDENVPVIKKVKTNKSKENVFTEKNEETSKKSQKKENQKTLLANKTEKVEIKTEKNSNKRKRDEENNKLEFEVEEDEEEIDEEQTPKDLKINKLLDLSIPECGFKWDNSINNMQVAEESSSDSEEETEKMSNPKKKKLTPAERRELERQKERELREREEALASCQIPQTVDQFDRLVLSSPDSSLVWMQYMAYHLQATEIEKARAVSRRALKTINFREEDERLNVWQAWLNLESRFGTPESLTDVFQEAVQTNDAQKIYSHMLTVHTDAGRQAELEKLVNTMISKFKQNPETWISCGSSLLKIGMKEKSRHIMQRALQSLPASKHVDLMVRFAQLENKFGDKERSQTLFEKILSSYPKRTDVWSSYVDSLVKSESIDIARKVLDRAIAQALPAKKMKVLFKKYISFEEKHGTPDNVARIQQLAVQYVNEVCNKAS